VRGRGSRRVYMYRPGGSRVRKGARWGRSGEAQVIICDDGTDDPLHNWDEQCAYTKRGIRAQICALEKSAPVRRASRRRLRGCGESAPTGGAEKNVLPLASGSGDNTFCRVESTRVGVLLHQLPQLLGTLPVYRMATAQHPHLALGRKVRYDAKRSRGCVNMSRQCISGTTGSAVGARTRGAHRTSRRQDG
jgi:hypothetical protein